MATKKEQQERILCRCGSSSKMFSKVDVWCLVMCVKADVFRLLFDMSVRIFL
jgi:hypothetical protein